MLDDVSRDQNQRQIWASHTASIPADVLETLKVLGDLGDGCRNDGVVWADQVRRMPRVTQRHTRDIPRAIKKMLRHRAMTIKASFMPVGYSVPSSRVRVRSIESPDLDTAVVCRASSACFSLSVGVGMRTEVGASASEGGSPATDVFSSPAMLVAAIVAASDSGSADLAGTASLSSMASRYGSMAGCGFGGLSTI